MKKSIIFLICCLSFVLGIFISSFFIFDDFYIFCILIFCLIMSIVGWGNFKFRLVFLIILFLCLGLWRGLVAQPNIDGGHIAFQAGEEMEFNGQVIAEPDERIDKIKLTVGNINICDLEGDIPECRLQGKILINAPTFPKFEYGDWVEVKCKIERPGKFEEFDYGQYLAVRNIYAVCYRPEYINHIETRHGASLQNNKLFLPQKIYRGLINFKFKSKNIIDKVVAYPESEILSAMILGLKRNIPEYITEAFSRAGLSHIIAISGLHITIVAGLLLNLLLALGLKRKHAFYLAVLGLILFLLLIGFRASSVRAGIMGFLVLLALHTGRLSQSLNSLLLAAVILLLINPQLLLYDIGFQLSFLAVLGIIYLGEPLENLLKKLKVTSWMQIRSSLMMTLSAQALVLPLIVYYFGNLSVIAPVANILILPLLPFIMIIGFIVIILGFVFLPLAQVLGYGLKILVDWVLLIAEFLSKLPGSNFEIKQIEFVWILLIYALLFAFIYLIRNRYES